MSSHDLRFEKVPAELDLPGVSPAKFLVMGLAAAAMASAFSFSVAHFVVTQRTETHTRSIDERLHIRGGIRAEVMNAWAEGTFRLADSVVKADVVRLFATEVDIARQKDTKATGPYQAQAPYMQVVLQDFVRQNNLAFAALVDRNGNSFVQSNPTGTITEAQKVGVQQVFSSGQPFTLPAYTTENGSLMVDVFVPVKKLDDADANVSGVMLMTVPVTDAFNKVLNPTPLTQTGEISRLLVKTDDSIKVIARDIGMVTPATAPRLRDEVTISSDPATGSEVYGLVAPVTQLPWMSVYEGYLRDDADATLQRAITTIYGLAGLVSIALTAIILSIIWKYISAKNKALASQYRDFARRINGQRRLLESITNAVDEQIVLKDKNGKYVYVNPAFTRFWSWTLDEAIGRSDVELVGKKFAADLAEGDGHAMTQGSWFKDDTHLHVGEKDKIVQIAKVPQIVDGEATGIVTVLRDVTDARAQKLRLEKLMESTVSALVRTVELRDPYLVGHSGRVERLSVALAHRLNLTADDAQTLRFAARLAQVGKVFVPRDILTKKTKLTKTEVQKIRSHVDHAVDILSDIDFGLPVLPVISQMYERMDGTGYPHKHKGKDILPLARVMAVADVLCALIAPRAYRKGKSIADAIDVLRDDEAQFDKTVLAALFHIVDTKGPDHLKEIIEGEKA
jgi:PAS domain S-box-containing protein